MMLTNFKSFFVVVYMPSAKQCNSSCMYSLKVYLLRLPILCISLLMYLASNSALAPPDLRELVSTMSTGIPVKDI